MNWYLAKIVYRIICGDGGHTPQFDEQLRLLAAADRDEAITKAKQVGRQEEVIFQNTKNELVKWQFISVTELYGLNEMIDGAEVYSRIEEREHAEEYIRQLNLRGATLEKNDPGKLLSLI